MTTVSTRADALLQKRCAFLESKLEWPSNVPAIPPPGMKYLHFRANGLTSVCTKSPHMIRTDEAFLANSGAHHSALWAGAYEAQRTLTDISWADLKQYGVNPLNHPAHGAEGMQLRVDWRSFIYGLYKAWPDYATPTTYQVSQLYKSYPLTPDGPNTSWVYQRLDLLGKVRTNPLIADLGQRHVQEASAYMWSARLAGFPDSNFEHSGTAYSVHRPYVPHSTMHIGETSSTSSRGLTTTLYHHPTVLLMTVAVPDDIEAWLADEANAGQTQSLTIYGRWSAAPHWMGSGALVADNYYGRSSPQKLPYSQGQVSTLSIYNTCHYIYSTNISERDLVIYTPADGHNNHLRAPAL